MQAVAVPGRQQAIRAYAFVLYLVGGVAVFLLGANTFRIFPTNKNALYEWGLTLAFALLVVALRRSERWRGLSKVALALLVAALANAVNLHLGNWLAPLLPVAGSLFQTLAIDKVSQAVPVVLTLILATLLLGDDLASIFLQRGKLRQGLTFGLISFAVFAAIFTVIAVVQAGGPATTGIAASGVRMDVLIAAAPWILVFCLANGFMEELWFRGVTLGKLTPLLGAPASILVTAIVFGSCHLGATYITSAEILIFPTIVFALGLVNGLVMLKTGSIWGSVLFHAGYDLLTIIPILASAR